MLRSRSEADDSSASDPLGASGAEPTRGGGGRRSCEGGCYYTTQVCQPIAMFMSALSILGTAMLMIMLISLTYPDRQIERMITTPMYDASVKHGDLVAEPLSWA